MTLPPTPEPGGHMAEQTKSRNFFPPCSVGLWAQKRGRISKSLCTFSCSGTLALSERGALGSVFAWWLAPGMLRSQSVSLY